MTRVFRQFSESSHTRNSGRPADVLSEFVEGNVLALNNLRELVKDADLRAAVELIDDAETVYVVGFRRSLPVSSYLAYSLQQLNKKTIFVDGVGGLTRQQMQSIKAHDLLIVLVSVQAHHQALVDFQLLHRQRLELRE